MARKKPHPTHENHERWLVSYADFITLMFAFFVVMFASSQTDKAKAVKVSESVKAALEKSSVAAAVHEILGGTVDERGKGNAMMKGPGGAVRSPKEGPAPAPVAAELVPSMEYLTEALADEIRAGKIDLKLEKRGLVMSLEQATFFPSGGETVDPATYGTVEKIANHLRNLPNPVRLEGHTDSVPIHTGRFRSNWDLSAARAISMMDLLHERFQLPLQRMAIAGYADTMPKASNETEAGRARNRRVDMVILAQQAMVAEPSAILPIKTVATPGAHPPARQSSPPLKAITSK